MTDEEIEKEAEKAWSDKFPLYKLVAAEMWKDVSWKFFRIGYLAGRRKGMEEIVRLKAIIDAARRSRNERNHD